MFRRVLSFSRHLINESHETDTASLSCSVSSRSYYVRQEKGDSFRSYEGIWVGENNVDLWKPLRKGNILCL